MEGKRVLVTAAGKGLGYAIVKKFYEQGAIVFALDKNKEALKALKKEFRNVTLICVDLEDWAETKRKVKSICPIHHLVNAVDSQTGYFQEIDPKQIDELFNVNYKVFINVTPTEVVREFFVSNPEIIQETQKILDRQVIKRPMQPSEAADIVMFLSSTTATGSAVPVEG